MEIKDEELEKLYEETFHGVEAGSVITGKVISIKPDSIFVDVGYKSEGIVDGNEFSQEEMAGLVIGDDIEVFVVRTVDAEGMLVLSKSKASRIKMWSVIEECHKDNSSIEGIIIEKTKGGAFVDISSVKAFMPASHIDLKPVRDIEQLIGQKVEMKIIQVNNRRSNVIVSRRLHLEEERMSMKEATLKKLTEGTVINGIVKNITDYGVFIDLGGIDGLLHISDISWGRITHPSKHFDIGQEIDVIVLKFDAETEKVTLGFKQRMPDPWEKVDEKYPVGTSVKGRVVSITDYGAFVEVEDALEGLVHASEIEWAPRPKHPSKYLKVDDEVEALVLKADRDERRLSLSLKQLKASPWEQVAEKYQVGDRIIGKVRGLIDFGAFIGLPEGVDGLVHISDLSWTKHIRHPSEVLKKGQTVEAVVLSIEPEKDRMALGVKQLVSDPWLSEIPEQYKIGEEISCKVLRKTEHGLFVELDGEVEGLIYASEIEDGGSAIQEGDDVLSLIIKVDLDNRKIGLSMKNVKGLLDEKDTADTV